MVILEAILFGLILGGCLCVAYLTLVHPYLTQKKPFRYYWRELGKDEENGPDWKEFATLDGALRAAFADIKGGEGRVPDRIVATTGLYRVEAGEIETIYASLPHGERKTY